MTQAELARRLEIPRQQVQHYVRGTRVMPLQMAYAISLILECTVEELYDISLDK